MTTNHSLLIAPLGGTLLGASLAFVTAMTGRRAGVSALAGALLSGKRAERPFAVAFLGGLAVTGGMLAALVPGVAVDESGRPGIAFLLGGVLVGWGARRANGCTSGHGILGVSRTSPRSFVALALFALGASIVVAIWPAGGAS
jgi:hypothetical protein